MQFAHWSDFIIGVKFFPRMLSYRKHLLLGDFVFPVNYLKVYVPGDYTGSFCHPGQHLTTLDTLLGHNLSRDMFRDNMVLLLL